MVSTLCPPVVLMTQWVDVGTRARSGAANQLLGRMVSEGRLGSPLMCR
jgi:hypothetical protein